MQYSILTLQKWCEYAQHKVASPMKIVNAALTPYIDGISDTAVVVVLNNKKTTLCVLRPFETENVCVCIEVKAGDNLKMFLEGENDVDMLIKEV